MSGHGNREISGLRFALGTKSFVARLGVSAASKMEFKRTKRKTTESVEPYWKFKYYQNLLDLGGYQKVSPGAFIDYPGQIGDIDWQNDQECLTWFNNGEYSNHRYQYPFINRVNTYLYHKGKVSQSCGQKIVGACINKLIGKRYIIVTVQRASEIDTLSVWSVTNFEEDDWTLLHTLPSLEADQQLKTSVFFNRAGTEAVSTLEYSTGATTKRLRISIAKNVEGTALVITSAIENPYPYCAETRSSDGFTQSSSITGQSLMACDYLHIKNRTSEDEDVLIELVYQFNESSISTNTYNSTTDEVGTYYSQTSTEYTVIRTGNYQLIRNGITILTLPDNYNDYHHYYTDATYFPTRVLGGGTTTHDRYDIVDIDLRTLSLVVIRWDCEEIQTAQVESYATDLVGTGSKKYQLIEPNSLGNFPSEYLTFYEESMIYTRLIPAFTAPSWVGNGELLPIYPESTSPASVNTTGKWYNADYFSGHLKSLLRKSDSFLFLSFFYFRPASGSDYGNVPELTFTMYYLTDGDPKVLSGTSYETFFTLSVI